MILRGTDWYCWWVKPGITGKLELLYKLYVLSPTNIDGIDKQTSNLNKV